MAIQTSQISPQEDTETKTKSVYDQYDKLHSVVYYDKNNQVEKVVKVKVDPLGRIKESKTFKQIKIDVLQQASAGTTSMVLKGSILDAGTVPVLATGFLYWNNANDPGLSIGGAAVSTAQNSFMTGTFENAVTNLVKNTTYYYRAFATNEYGTNYSEIYAVTTLNDPDLVIAGTTTGVTPFAISLSANDADDTPLSYAWNLTGGNTAQFTTRVANFTYNVAGTYTANLTGFYGGGITAIRSSVITVNEGNVVLSDWATVQAAAFYANTIAAYDMRNREGSTINAIVGPNLQSVNTTLSAGLGTVFVGDGSYLFSNATIPVTFPHTLVLVGRINVAGAANETVLINAQKIKWQQTSNENVVIFGRPNQLNAYNGSDNQHMGYVPNGSEFFYVAASFLANNTVRYQIRSKTQNRNGTVSGNASKLNFNGFVGFGAGLGSATNYGYVGIVRLGMFINQEFTTEAAMTTLFETITAGPANQLLV